MSSEICFTVLLTYQVPVRLGKSFEKHTVGKSGVSCCFLPHSSFINLLGDCSVRDLMLEIVLGYHIITNARDYHCHCERAVHTLAKTDDIEVVCRERIMLEEEEMKRAGKCQTWNT